MRRPHQRVPKCGLNQPRQSFGHAQVSAASNIRVRIAKWQHRCPQDLLFHECGGLRSEHDFGAALIRLEFSERGLDLPPLAVGVGEVDRGDVVGIEECGEQAERAHLGAAPVIDVVVDDADDDVFGVEAELLARISASHDPSWRVSIRRGLALLFGSPDQIGSGRRCLFPRLETHEPAIRGQHHAGFETIQERL